MATDSGLSDHIDATFSALTELRYLRQRAKRQAESLPLYEQRLRAEGRIVGYSVGIAKLEAIVNGTTRVVRGDDGRGIRGGGARRAVG